MTEELRLAAGDARPRCIAGFSTARRTSGYAAAASCSARRARLADSNSSGSTCCSPNIGFSTILYSMPQL
eukprot:scaffold29745_cov76-Phaeocystis_antarctica.AAC.4